MPIHVEKEIEAAAQDRAGWMHDSDRVEWSMDCAALEETKTSKSNAVEMRTHAHGWLRH